jgi:uncharacterized protein YbbK (DUF523 family)
MVRVLVSACLLGQRVRYDGADARSASAVLARWTAEGRVVPFCPEVAGGLPVPRPPAEIRGRGGGAVLEATAQVVTRAGDDVTAAFLRGAREALALARREGLNLAVLKEGSPSCGSSAIHDGAFTGRRVPGQGVTASLLRRSGIQVFSEHQLEEAAAAMAALEAD